jgi:hypothetical protein
MRSVGLAIGAFLILLGLTAFAVRGTTWRKDAWSEWRSDWQPAIVIQEKQPWILLGAGFMIMSATKAFAGGKA